MRFTLEDLQAANLDVCWSDEAILEFFAYAGVRCSSLETLTRYALNMYPSKLRDFAWVLLQLAAKLAPKAYLTYVGTHHVAYLVQSCALKGEIPKWYRVWSRVWDSSIHASYNADDLELQKLCWVWLANMIDNEVQEGASAA